MTSSMEFTTTIDLGKVSDDGREGARDGLRLATEHVLKVSRDQVPHEEATLERSGVASVDDEDLVGAVSYDTPYAVVQHEDMSLEHDAGRNAKYLENAFNSEANVVGALIAEAIRRKIGTA